MNVTIGVVAALFVLFVALPFLVCGGLATCGAASVATAELEAKKPVVNEAGEEVAPLEVVSIDSRVTETNDMWAKHAYLLKVKNNTARDRTFRATIQWTDAEGFMLNKKIERNLEVFANSERTFNGDDLIMFPAAGNVSSVGVEIR